mmetsp:Transcript_5472/g.12688  ORF Transcript_5472/g.12688 Transcript_5472/m.12688 type:complete len:212 (+) Transcript_5472:126-761(+)
MVRHSIWMSIALTALLQRTCSGLSLSTRIGARLQVTRKAPLRRTFAVSSTITTVALEHEEEETVKKSRFVARCAPAVTFSSAKEFIDRVSDPKARHNCWAWCGEKSQRSNDDGEPSGTAGRPILNSIEGEGLLNVVVVVTRFASISWNNSTCIACLHPYLAKLSNQIDIDTSPRTPQCSERAASSGPMAARQALCYAQPLVSKSFQWSRSS